MSDTPCIEWAGTRDSHGYGISQKNKKRRKAHRVAWEAKFGPIPDGMLVCHRCDNPPCVNPDHLFLGTHSDNTRDMIAKGRSKLDRYAARKVTDYEVAAIRMAYDEGGVSTRRLAAMTGVSKSSVHAIVSRRAFA